MEERISFIQYLIDAHGKISKKIENEDIEKVIKDAHIMYNICHSTFGFHRGFLAIAHPQIEKKSPLRFFITEDNEIIINPVIIRHTKTTIDSEEGCATFLDRNPIIVQRYNKCEVKYQTLIDNKLSEFKLEELSSLRARVFQHEIDHLDAIYIYDK